MKLVLTNDDGIDAPGIDALRRACEGLGETVTVAPNDPLSGVSHRVTTHFPIPVRVEDDGRHRVCGTPADCTRLALAEIVPDADWVLAGINQGANLGTDAYLSGTIAAVREAALLGKPAIAVSQYIGLGRKPDWTLATRRAARVIREIIASPVDRAHYWSINLPDTGASDADPEVVRCDLDSSPMAVRFESTEEGYVWAGDYHGRPRIPGRDVDVCFGGRIAVTRIPLDLAAG